MIDTKKAYFEADIISFLIIIIFLILLVISFNFVKLSDSHVIEYKEKLNNDLMLINILRSPVDDKTLGDIILLDYSRSDFSNTKNSLNNILTVAFGEKICYELNIDDNKIEEHNDCTKLNKFFGNFKAELTLPYDNKKIKLTLK